MYEYADRPGLCTQTQHLHTGLPCLTAHVYLRYSIPSVCLCVPHQNCFQSLLVPVPKAGHSGRLLPPALNRPVVHLTSGIQSLRLSTIDKPLFPHFPPFPQPHPSNISSKGISRRLLALFTVLSPANEIRVLNPAQGSYITAATLLLLSTIGSFHSTSTRGQATKKRGVATSEEQKKRKRRLNKKKKITDGNTYFTRHAITLGIHSFLLRQRPAHRAH
ncbi:hypothetical protein HDV57DRAFT_292395 [Trichoderma longibrachiatum]